VRQTSESNIAQQAYEPNTTTNIIISAVSFNAASQTTAIDGRGNEADEGEDGDNEDDADEDDYNDDEDDAAEMSYYSRTVWRKHHDDGGDDSAFSDGAISGEGSATWGDGLSGGSRSGDDFYDRLADIDVAAMSASSSEAPSPSCDGDGRTTGGGGGVPHPAADVPWHAPARLFERRMALLRHASACTDAMCPLDGCDRVKALLSHREACRRSVGEEKEGDECEHLYDDDDDDDPATATASASAASAAAVVTARRRPRGGCTRCRRALALLAAHARECVLFRCPVPECARLRAGALARAWRSSLHGGGDESGDDDDELGDGGPSERSDGAPPTAARRAGGATAAFGAEGVPRPTALRVAYRAAVLVPEPLCIEFGHSPLLGMTYDGPAMRARRRRLAATPPASLPPRALLSLLAPPQRAGDQRRRDDLLGGVDDCSLGCSAVLVVWRERCCGVTCEKRRG
jgi:hypothetical protein